MIDKLWKSDSGVWTVEADAIFYSGRSDSPNADRLIMKTPVISRRSFLSRLGIPRNEFIDGQDFIPGCLEPFGAGTRDLATTRL